MEVGGIMEIVLTALIIVAGMSFQSWILTHKQIKKPVPVIQHEIPEIDEKERMKREKQMAALKQMASMNVTDQLNLMREKRTVVK